MKHSKCELYFIVYPNAQQENKQEYQHI